jgi:pimeloyl-ACP methyl ester carboxylesterase
MRNVTLTNGSSGETLLATKIHSIGTAQKSGAVADLIFVHGIDGDPFTTWRAEGAEADWLGWLDEALPDVNVHTIGYEASASHWLGDHAMPIYDRATNLLDLLATKRIGDRPIIFIAHSLGGLVIKRLLENANGSPEPKYQQILSNTRGVVFLATPHQGSSTVPAFNTFRRLARLSELGAELAPNTSQLRSSYVWYRDNSEKLKIKTHSFVETLDVPVFGRIVDHATSDPGVGLTTPLHADHLTICKPSDVSSQVYISVLSFIRDLVPEKDTVIEQPRQRFADLASFDLLIKELEKQFFFRWEQCSYEVGAKSPTIFWPVRLRHPTLIHASQCFAAAGLQQRGAEIHFFIDDLGSQDYPVDSFKKELMRWFAMVGGDAEQVSAQTFSGIIPPLEATSDASLDPWPIVRKWLGDSAYKLEQTFRVSKLVRPYEVATLTIQSLNERRPRRLLTPALVWSCLAFLHANNPDRTIITLGGYDEQELWEAWRDRLISPTAKVGHLYAPQLDDFDNQHGAGALHMARTKSLEWNSLDDIRNALQAELSKTGWHGPGRLIPWSLNNCVFLARFVSGQELKFAALEPSTQFDSLAPQQFIPHLTNELERWLL